MQFAAVSAYCALSDPFADRMLERCADLAMVAPRCLSAVWPVKAPNSLYSALFLQGVAEEVE
ncbi:MAG: hypothetical protein EOS78_04795 [Mesorhizobium sp.]|nr:MAG: hypothetical protein EOS78_04795 [Mesorhizobium sp.]